MKIRRGFVSNSSSSSFIVAFDHIPLSSEEMKEMLFGDKSEYSSYDSHKIAEIVYRDMVDQMPLSYKEIVDEVKLSVYIEAYDNIRNNALRDGHIDFSEVERDTEKWAKENSKDFISSNKGKYFFSFTYGDENGAMESAMERNGLFNSLPHYYINGH